ncbi:hypothetical protein SBY92_002468 [Candida maltosa Xu316]
MKSSMITTIYNGKLPSLVSDQNGIFTWCPYLNLIFVSMNKTSIWCYRINGERIYSINNKSPIKHITFDEHFFCLSGVDNLIKFYNSNNGQLIKVLDNGFNNIQFIQWNTTSFRSPQSQLPKIYDLVNELNYLVIKDDESITFNFNQLLTVKFNCGETIQQQIVTDLFEQVYLSDDDLIMVKLNVPDRKLYTEQIIKICQIISLLEYSELRIKELKELVAPFVQSLDRYISNLESECEETGMFQYLTDVLITNIIPESTKDFWLNQYGERGYKKMSKLSSVYESAVKLVFQHLISSMERIIIIISDLIGISKWGKGMLTVNTLETMLVNAKSQLKGYYRFIWDLQSEREIFTEFLSWTKTIIDMLNDQEYEVCYSTTNVLTFINDALTKCAVLKYFDFDLDVLRNDEEKDVLTNMSIDLTEVDTYHRSIISVEKIQHVNLPEAFTDLRLAIWEKEIIITYIRDSSLVISNLQSTVSVVPNVQAYEHRDGDLVALTKNGSLLIINSSSCIPLPLPEISFQPHNLKLNASHGVLLDSLRQNYLIFKI